MSHRSQAKSAGQTRYLTGKPCPKGHLVERMVSNGRCCTCMKEYKRKRRNENPKEHADYMRSWHEKNKDKEAQYRRENREAMNQRMREWRADNPERDAKNRMLWASKNRDRIREKSRAWRENNRSRDRELNKRWRENNPEKQRVIMFNRNCATRGLRQAVKHGIINEIMSEQNCLCNYCMTGVSTEFHVDHKTPVSRGGDNSKNNLQILCPTCNLRKGAKTDAEFLDKLNEEKRDAT